MPVDKHESDNSFTHPDPEGGVKGHVFKFCNNSVSCQYFKELSHADRGTINTKHIKRDFRSKACVSPLRTSVVGSKGKNSTFSKHGHVAYKIKRDSRMQLQLHGCNYFARRPPDPRDGVCRSKFIFLEHGHVAYQIKENHECSSTQANILPADPYPPPPPPPHTHTHTRDPLDVVNRSKFIFFRTWSCCIPI